MTKRGYVALHRSIFEKELTNGRREAWIWIFTHAAFEATEHHLKRGTIAVDRGQLATSTRALACEWGWPQPRVRRFLAFLKREKMVTIAPPNSLPNSLKWSPGMVITVCNYDKFQKSSPGKKPHPTRYPTRSKQLSLLLPITCEPQEPNKRIDRLNEVSGKGRLAAKLGGKHGKTSKFGTMYIRAGTECWAAHAEDFKAVLGYEPQPDRDGGVWFWPAGEENRPPELHHLRPPPPVIRKIG